VANINSTLIRAASLIGAAAYLLQIVTSWKARQKLQTANDALDAINRIDRNAN
jgi:hypothetical protein